jgi:hypothetical protein
MERGPDRILLVGAPVAEALLGDHILEDLALLVPFSILFICAVIVVGAGRLAGAFIGLLKAAVCMLFAAGLMGWCGIPLYLPSAVLPIVLTSMSLVDEIHLLARYQELAGTGSREEAVHRTFDELASPVVLGTASSCVGFLSLLASSVRPLAAFGLVSSLGIACGMVFSLTATPALLSRLSGTAGRPARTGEIAARWWRRAAGGLAAVAARRRAVLAAMAIATLAAVAAGSRLIVQDGWIDSFAPGSQLRLQTSAVNARMFGVHVLRARLRFPARAPGTTPPLSDPQIVKALGAVEQDLGGIGQAGGALGLHAQLLALAHFWNLAAPEGGLPDDPVELERLLSRFELNPGMDRRREVVADSLDDTVITVFLKHANYRDTARLMAAATGGIHARLGWASPSLSWGGDVAVSQAMIESIVRSQLTSLPLALLGAFAVAALVHGSARLALYALLPAAMSSVWLLGGMGWLEIPLGVATSMFFSIVVGLGVDSQSIHYLNAYARSCNEGSADPAGEALARTVRPVLVNTFSIAIGFGLLSVSSVPSNARLGALIALGMVAGAAISTIGLTALLRSRPSAPRAEFQHSNQEVVP